MNQSSIEYNVHPTTTGVCINCTFLDDSATDCFIVIHQRVSQLNSSGLMNIESSHRFHRSGNTAFGCVEGVNLTVSQVGVIQGKYLPLSHSMASAICTWCIVGTGSYSLDICESLACFDSISLTSIKFNSTVLVAVFLLVLIIVVIISSLMYRKMKK